MKSDARAISPRAIAALTLTVMAVVVAGVVIYPLFRAVTNGEAHSATSTAISFRQGLQAIPNPLPPPNERFMERLTWLEIRDLIASGNHTVLVPTGGVEQNGPFVVTGKHNVLVTAMAGAIATSLGSALVAPVVGFVPQGALDPPEGHQRYPGTIGVSAETFEALLYDICRSLMDDGFRHIVLLGDSGGNQAGQAAVAARFNQVFRETDVQVHHLATYYETDRWGYEQLKTLGIHQSPDVQSAQRADIHSDYFYEAMLAAIDPEAIRADERRELDRFSINGVPLDPLPATIAVGKALMAERVRLAVGEIRRITGDP